MAVSELVRKGADFQFASVRLGFGVRLLAASWSATLKKFPIWEGGPVLGTKMSEQSGALG